METILMLLLEKKLSSSSFDANVILDSLDKERILRDLRNVKDKYLYDSFIHGRNHSDKVYLFSYILGRIKNLSEDDMKIVLDAALYHDIGRTVDSEDTVHGYTSAHWLEEKQILDDPFYDNVENKILLYGIISGHSLPDDRKKCEFDNQCYEYDREYEEELYQRYSTLYNILKDADALDRTRFGRKSYATVDPDFLRIEESKGLIDFAYAINDVYKKEMIKGYKEHIKDLNKGGLCFHSIGFDFTKVAPILNNGVLSLSERVRMNLNVPSNFEGGNSDRWISVVDINAIKKSAGAFYTFTKNGIGFLCNADEMIKGYSNKERGKAIEQGYPYDKGDYEDERYVYKRIPASKIIGVVVPEEYQTKSLKDLIYIHNSMTIEIYESSIKKYERMLEEKGIFLDRVAITRLLEEYKNVLKSFRVAHGTERENIRRTMPIELSRITKEVSAIIGSGLEVYYELELNKDHVTVSDVVAYEMSRANTRFEVLDEGLFLVDSAAKDILVETIEKLK